MSVGACVKIWNLISCSGWCDWLQCLNIALVFVWRCSKILFLVIQCIGLYSLYGCRWLGRLHSLICSCSVGPLGVV